MRRGIFVSSLLIAGSALCAPAFAQAQDKPVETPASSDPKAIAVAKPARPEPLLATPNGQVTDKARELAEADLAAAPDGDVQPLRVDPNQAGRRGYGLAGPATIATAEAPTDLAERAPEALPAPTGARPEPKPVIEAEARPAPAEAGSAPATPRAIAEEQPTLAEQETNSGQLREGGDPVVKPVYAQRRYEAVGEPLAEPERGDPVVRPTYRQRRWEPKPVERAERAPVDRPNAAEDDGRPDYVEAERIVREVNAAPAAPASAVAEASAPVTQTARVTESAPVAMPVQSAEAASVEEASHVADTADEAGDSAREALRDASRVARVVRQTGRVARVLGGAAVGAAADPPVLADEEERGERPVYAEEKPEGSVYAEEPRDYPPVHAEERPLRQRVDYSARFSNRLTTDSCDSHRYEGLARSVRRAVEVGSIDWRTARDMDDEIAHGMALQRGYCESGMNDWRERRLDEQYTQIEDRLRFERRRFR